MLKYAAISLIIAVAALLLGFIVPGVIASAVWIIKGVFFIALILSIVLFGWDMVKRHKRKA